MYVLYTNHTVDTDQSTKPVQYYQCGQHYSDHTKCAIHYAGIEPVYHSITKDILSYIPIPYHYLGILT